MKSKSIEEDRTPPPHGQGPEAYLAWLRNPTSQLGKIWAAQKKENKKPKIRRKDHKTGIVRSHTEYEGDALSEGAPGIESMGYGLPAHVAKLLAKKGLSHVFWLHNRMSGALPKRGKRPANEGRTPEEHIKDISKAREEELTRLRSALSKRGKDFKGHRKSIGDRAYQVRMKYQKRLRSRRAAAQLAASTEYEGFSIKEVTKKLITKTAGGMIARHREEAEEEKRVPQTTPYGKGYAEGQHQAHKVWLQRRAKRLLHKLTARQNKKTLKADEGTSIEEISSRYIKRAMKRDVKQTRKVTKAEVEQAKWGSFPARKGVRGFANTIAREFVGGKVQKRGEEREKEIRKRGSDLTALNKERQEQRRTAGRAAMSRSSNAPEEPDTPAEPRREPPPLPTRATTPTAPRREEEPDTPQSDATRLSRAVTRMRARQSDAAEASPPQQASVTRTSTPTRKEDDIELKGLIPKSVKRGAKALGGMALSRLKSAPGRLIKFAKGGADPSGEEGRAALNKLEPGGAAWKPKVTAKRTWGKEFRTRVKLVKQKEKTVGEMLSYIKEQLHPQPQGAPKKKKKKLRPGVPATKEERRQQAREEGGSGAVLPKKPHATKF